MAAPPKENGRLQTVCSTGLFTLSSSERQQLQEHEVAETENAEAEPINFAELLSLNGKCGASPPNGKATAGHRGNSAISTKGEHDGTCDQAQVQSRNGSNGHERAGIFVSKQTLDTIWKHHSRRAADILALLTFYHYTALWQQTNQPKASVEYVAKGLHWNHDKVRAIRSLLRELKLIEDVRAVNPVTHKVTGWFVHLRFFQPVPYENPPSPQNHRVDSEEGNALRSVKVNALRSDKKFSNENKVLKNTARGQAAGVVSFDLASPEERELIDIYHSAFGQYRLLSRRKRCTRDSWRPVTRYTDKLQQALAVCYPDCFRVLCFEVAEACADGYDEDDVELGVPPLTRKGYRTIIDLVWANY